MVQRGRAPGPLASEEAKRQRSRLGDLNDLDVFCRVVEQAGFSHAAAALGVPASSVSRRIARLEESLGVRLLQRTTRTLHLTEAGQTYYDEVSRALSDIASAETSLQVTQGSPRGRVRVTTVSEPSGMRQLRLRRLWERAPVIAIAAPSRDGGEAWLRLARRAP